MSTAISLNGSENIKNQLKLVGLSGELVGGAVGSTKAEEITVSTLPYDFYQGSAVVYNGEIHILGGNKNTTKHYKWNGISWNEVSTLPYDFYNGCAVIYNNEIHILGGSSSQAHYKWNGTSWSSVSTLPINYFYFGSAVIYNNEIHILGDGGNAATHYKWNGTSWTSVSTLPYGLCRGAAVVYNGEIHILGGSITNTKTKHYKWNETSWSELLDMPFEFFGGTAVVFDNCIYVGSARIDTARDLYKWDGEEWSYVLSPYDFNNGCAVVYNNAIHALGGSTDDTTKTNHKSLVHIQTSGWTAVHEDPEDPTSDITGYTQDAAVQGITANDILFVSLDNSQMSADDVKETEKAMVRCVSQSLDTLSFAATKCPQCDISLNIVKQGGGAS